MLLKILCFIYLIIISFLDYFTFKIPNKITLAFFFLLLCLDIFTNPERIPAKLFCSLFFFTIFLATAYFTKGIGMGDIKLAGLLGYCLGFFQTSLVFIFSCFFGIIVFLVLRKLKYKIKQVPFVPFVTVGYLVSELCCRRIL